MKLSRTDGYVREIARYKIYWKIRIFCQTMIVPQTFGGVDSAGKIFQENPLSFRYKQPVPKPTQVVEERILRCSSDSRLRN